MALPNTHSQDSPRGGIVAACKRGMTGLLDGAQTGAFIGAGLAGTALLCGAMGLPGVTEFLHLSADPLTGALGLTAAHSVGAAAFECASEAYDGYNDRASGDHIKNTAKTLDRKLLAFEQDGLAQMAHQHGHSFDYSQPETSHAVQSILAQGPDARAQTSWQERIAAQQALQSMRDRTV